MLSDEQGRTAVSSLGWVDQAALWVFRDGDRTAHTIKLSDAKYLVLVPGRENHFSAVHHFDGSQVEISVHAFDDPGQTLARARIGPEGSSLAGDLSRWELVPTHYTAYFTRPPIAASVLLCIGPEKGHIEVQQLGWYSTGYDLGYQGLIGVTEVPHNDLLLFAVQRSSELVLYDPTSQGKVGSIQLAGRGGNPTPYYRRYASELWADDYDTLVKLDASTGAMMGSRLMEARVAGRQFMGRFAFDRLETVCVLARPFSGDVVGLDPSTLEITHRCVIGRQPLEAVMLIDKAIVARDWRSGALLQGRLEAV